VKPTSPGNTVETPLFIALLMRYRRSLLYIALTTLLLVVLGSRFIAGRQASREQDYLQAHLLLRELTSEQASASAITALEGILYRHGELHAKYDGPLAQCYLKNENALEARAYASDLLGRTSPFAEQYADFSRGSLLIAEHRFHDALTEAEALHLSLKEEEAPLLMAHNLLRIALLEGEIGLPEREREAWSKLVEQIEGQPALYGAFIQAFTAGDLSILDYAKARLEHLDS
jgi:hypothetical protein